MEKQRAQAIVKDTFQNAFDKERFTRFIKELLNHIEPAPFVYRGNIVPNAYEHHISTLERIGKYSDGEHEIDVLIVKLKKTVSIERARTMQRNFIAWYLNGSRGDKMKDAALVAFVAPDEQDWRFSLVKMEYKFEAGKRKRMKIKEEFTPAKRWSFLVGVNENSHMAQSRLAPIVEDDEHNPTLQQLEDAFNIEKVTKEFFEKYRDLFLRVSEILQNIADKDNRLKNDFADKNVSIADFSKKLLGQIVFLYFLQKKGWFGVSMNKTWGEGDKKFMRTLFQKSQSENKNYFNDFLEPLFYEALAKERDDDYYSRFECKIPFLNGGLFDPISNYDWVNTVIDLPDDLFSNTRKTKQGDIGDGILDIFDRYNFTVKEDEPLEKEVAVDPEMLGKVFENLLEVKDRKSKGTYYTPREIVHYMCEQSLVNYLATKLEGKVGKEDIEQLVKYGETVGENEIYIQNEGKETPTYQYKLPESVRKQAQDIDIALETVKVCDPAIGSGAFLVGMMNEIVKARNVLTSYLKNLERSAYNFKRNCIQNSLYGVDIDPGAVEIAKLRLWLSLVVDEEDIRQIKPLPNLDYKIMQGNSLLEEYEGVKLFDEDFIKSSVLIKNNNIKTLEERQKILQTEYISLHLSNKLTCLKKTEIDNELKKIGRALKALYHPSQEEIEAGKNPFESMKGKYRKTADQLKGLHKIFFETTQKSKKDIIKKQIEQLEWELIEATLKEQNKITALNKLEEFKRSNTKPFFLWRLHFAEVFQRKGGFDVVIANPPYVSVKEISEEAKKNFGKEFLTGKGRFNLFTLFLEKSQRLLKVDGVLTFILPEGLYSNVEYVYIRNYLLDNTTVLFISLFSDRVFDASVDASIISVKNSKFINGEFPVLKDLAKITAHLNQGEFKKLPFSLFSVNTDDGIRKIVDKVLSSFPENIEKVLEIQQGIIYSGQGKEEVFANKKINDSYKKVLDGRDVLKWNVNWENKAENKYILYSNKLHRPREERLFLADEKIVFPRKSIKIAGAYDDQQFYCLNTAYVCLPKSINYNLKFVLAVLNSKLINFFYSKLFFGWQVTIPALNCISLPPNHHKPIISFVEKILATTKEEIYIKDPSKQEKVRGYEKQIDRLVYRLYGLDEKEIRTVENHG